MCQCEDRPCCGCDAETRDGDTGMSKDDWLEVWAKKRKTMKNYKFDIDLIFEEDGSSMTVSFDCETDAPEDIIEGQWPYGFAEAILNNVSIVPLSYEESE